MTKKKLLLLTLLLFIGIFFIKKNEPLIIKNTSSHKADKQQTSAPLPVANVAEQKEVKEIKEAKKHDSPSLAPKKYVNTPAADWKEKLHESLLLQAGKSITDIEIKKEKSLVWVRDNNPLLVESVLISVKNNQNEQSSYRALVDAQTGKVLETWDQTIYEPADPREEFHLHVDARYAN
jgi:hypothetical protein